MEKLEAASSDGIRNRSVDGYFDGAPLRIGTGPQLLLDDAVVEDRWRLTRELCVPEKHARNPVLITDRPWEGSAITSFSVFYDPELGKYRMWYGAYVPFDRPPEGVGRACACYAESDDGIRWDKPLFPHYPAASHSNTNIVYRSACPSDPYAMICQVFRDENDPDPARRYKMISYESRPVDGKPQRGVNLAVSPDGFEWTLDGGQPVLDYNSDFPNHLAENATSTYSEDARGCGPYLDQSLPDVSLPVVAECLWRRHARILADGGDFWWQDQGERMDAIGANGYPMKNLNGSLWAKLVEIEVDGSRRIDVLYVHAIARPVAVEVNGVRVPEQPLERPRLPGWTFGPSDFPLQAGTEVLKISLPQPTASAVRSVRCVIRK